MKSIATRATLISIALCAALFGLAGTATASHVVLEIVGPAQLSVGQATDIRAMVHSIADGQPMAGETVTFYMRTSFDGVNGQLELGKVVTDRDGVAVLRYEPRSAGEHEIRAEYSTPGEGEPEVATWSHAATGTAQLYHSTAGVQVPGFDDRVIVVVVSAVWLLLFSVALRVIAIARAGDDAGATTGHSSPGRGHTAVSSGNKSGQP
jgi:hypothetical protein